MVTISNTEFFGEALFAGPRTKRYCFYKINGHLIVIEEVISISIFFIPAYYKETTWKRFQEIN
jgi:hypothetical protein